MHVVLLGLIVVLVWLFYQRSRELFMAHVNRGQLKLVRGRLPGSLRADFGAVLANTRRARVWARRTPDGARLGCSGVGDDVAQRLRNVFGLYPISKLTAREVDVDNTINRARNLEWLLSLLRRR